MLNSLRFLAASIIIDESLMLRKSRRVDPNRPLDKMFRPVKFCQKTSESGIAKILSNFSKGLFVGSFQRKRYPKSYLFGLFWPLLYTGRQT